MLDFQKRNNLKTDGLFGKAAAAARLAELEASFDLISVRVGGEDEPAAEVDETPASPAAGRTDESDGSNAASDGTERDATLGQRDGAVVSADHLHQQRRCREAVAAVRPGQVQHLELAKPTV